PTQELRQSASMLSAVTYWGAASMTVGWRRGWSWGTAAADRSVAGAAATGAGGAVRLAGGREGERVSEDEGTAEDAVRAAGGAAATGVIDTKGVMSKGMTLCSTGGMAMALALAANRLGWASGRSPA